MMKKRSLLFLPFALFAAFAFMLWYGLGNNDKSLPTALAGKDIPTFELPMLLSDGSYSNQSLISSGKKVTLVNYFASWCVPCRAEHPQLLKLAQHPDVEIVGIAYKNKVADAKRFLIQLGDPYATTLYDTRGRVAIDWGVSGVPETFIVSNGKIIERVGEPLVNPSAIAKLKDVLSQLGVEVDL
ncbi:MAG: DsbE family thiol:disulfide interchange protein [Alphaproteobacteria bacterium]